MNLSKSNLSKSNLSKSKLSSSRGKRALQIVLSIVAAAGACGLIAYSVSQSAGVYLKVDELMGNKKKWVNKKVWIGGRLVAPSKSHGGGAQNDSSSKKKHTFKLQWKGASVSVVYKGALPSRMEPNRQITVRGRLNEEGVFEATSVTTRCPSKYKAKSSHSSMH